MNNVIAILFAILVWFGQVISPNYDIVGYAQNERIVITEDTPDGCLKYNLDGSCKVLLSR